MQMSFSLFPEPHGGNSTSKGISPFLSLKSFTLSCHLWFIYQPALCTAGISPWMLYHFLHLLLHFQTSTARQVSVNVAFMYMSIHINFSKYTETSLNRSILEEREWSLNIFIYPKVWHGQTWSPNLKLSLPSSLPFSHPLLCPVLFFLIMLLKLSIF